MVHRVSQLDAPSGELFELTACNTESSTGLRSICGQPGGVPACRQREQDLCQRAEVTLGGFSGRVHGAREYTGLPAILRTVSLDDLQERF